MQLFLLLVTHLIQNIVQNKNNGYSKLRIVHLTMLIRDVLQCDLWMRFSYFMEMNKYISLRFQWESI